MKRKIIAVFCAVLMIVAVCIPAFAATTPSKADGRTNVVAGLTATLVKGDGTTTNVKAAFTDGDLGDNVNGKADSKWISKGDLGSLAPGGANIIKVDGADKAYYYLIQLELPEATDIDGFTLYLHGYKSIIMDRGFDIIVSADGQNWTKVYGATIDVADSYTEEYLAKYSAVYSDVLSDLEATADAATPAATASATFAKQTGIKYVAYACTAYREKDGHYTSRFTEFEVYQASATSEGTEGDVTTEGGATTEGGEGTGNSGSQGSSPSTGDNAINYIVAVAIVAVVGSTVVISRRKRVND